MTKNYKMYVIVFAIVVGMIIIASAATTSTVPKVAEFLSTDIKTPNFGTNNLKEGQIATITVNVKNISNETISDVYVKTTPKFSNDGEIIQIVDSEKKIPNKIGGGGTSGPLTINVKGIKVPTKEATEIILVELFVGNQSQEVKEIEINMVR